MGMLDIIWLLATVSSLTANVTHHYFMIWPGNSITACNWRIRIYCNESSVISILNIMVVNTTCDGNKCVCPTGLNDSIIIASEARTIPDYINDQCHNKTSCDSDLPHPGISTNKQMTNVTLHYKCTENTTGTDTDTDTYTSKGINSTSADMSTFTPPLTAGATENTTSSDTNQDTSTLIVTKGSTVAVNSSPLALTDSDTENTTGSDTNQDTSTLIVTKGTTVAVNSSPLALTDSDTENTTGSDANKDTSTFIVTKGRTVGVSSSPPAHTNSDTVNTTGSDATKTTSTFILTKGTTVAVYSSPTALTDGDTENTTGSGTNTDTSILKPTMETTVGTEKQSSSLNVVFVVVPTVLLLVAITLITVIIIARQKQRRINADDKTAIHSEFDTDMLHDGASYEATPSLNVNGVRHSRMADDNDDYNTINLITFPVTSDPTYNHVNLSITDPQYGRTNEPPLVDSDYASCADIDETAIQDHPYSHIINNTHTSNENNSNQGLTAGVSRSDYDHIELKNFNGNQIEESTSGDNPYSHTGTQLLNGRFLVDLDQCEDYYSHIGHVGHATDADCSKYRERGVAEARSSSYIVNTYETGTASKVDYENNESRDIHDSKEDTRGNVNVNELNGGEIYPQYQVKECDDSSHSYFILEKMQ